MQRALFLILILSCSLGNAQSIKRSAVFLGNSYTYVNNLPQLTADCALSAGDTLIFNSHTVGGYTLDQHNADTNSTNLIMQGGWDYVILQEQSQLPSFEEYEVNGPVNLTTLNNQYNPCGRVMFYMTWGRKNGDASNCAVWPPVCTYEGMDSLLRLRYIQMGDDYNSEVSPVGAVWRYIRQNYPLIELYDPDESHPSVAGSYAAACCFYAAIFKKDPTLITYNFNLNPTEADQIKLAAKIITYDSLAMWDFAEHNPVANFYYVAGPGQNEIILFSYSSGAELYSWDFGDGTIDSLENPVHTFATDGTYTVSLTATDCDIFQNFDSTISVDISFCSHTPTAFPDTLKLCPNTHDTLWTQSYDSYQWLDAQGRIISGETNQYFIPMYGDQYCVETTLNGCTERSKLVYVESYLNSFVIYHVDTINSTMSDTACMGDTLFLVLTPNKPIPPNHGVHWYFNGNPLTTNDTAVALNTGTYTVNVENTYCPGSVIYSGDHTFTFVHCTPGINEIDISELIDVYPNPVNTNFSVDVKPALLNRKFEIVDVLGREFQRGEFEKSKTTFDCTNMNGGFYFLRIPELNFTKKIIVQ